MAVKQTQLSAFGKPVENLNASYFFGPTKARNAFNFSECRDVVKRFMSGYGKSFASVPEIVNELGSDQRANEQENRQNDKASKFHNFFCSSFFRIVFPVFWVFKNFHASQAGHTRNVAGG